MTWPAAPGEASRGGLLSGIKVLDLCLALSGPYTSMMLAELGADVIKVEHPAAGDESRAWPPFSAGMSGYFATVNRSKRSIAVDLKQPDGLAVVLDLAGDADVVMQSFTPGVGDRLGVGYAAVRVVNPDVVYYSLSGYGQDGPWRTRRGYDPILQAVSGHMSVMGDEGGQPVKSMVPVADVSAAIHGCAAILGGLLCKERTGQGQHIDLSMLDVMTSMLVVVATRFLETGDVPGRHGAANPGRVPSAAFECADGRYLQLVPNQRQWPGFCRLVGRPEWITDSRFATPSARVDHADELYPALRAVLRTRNAADWDRLLTEINVACSPINDLKEVFDLEQVRHRGLVREYQGPSGERRKGLALPFRFSRTPARIRSGPPLLGEHTLAVLQGLGRTEAQIRRLLADGAVGAADDTAVSGAGDPASAGR
jgi:crotonobetainyl-CoA:carnitine CoA-transferase CaiB-like acyl-CoA transferase